MNPSTPRASGPLAGLRVAEFAGIASATQGPAPGHSVSADQVLARWF